MIKYFLKKLLYKIYLVGLNEDKNALKTAQRKKLSESSVFSDNVIFTDSTRIYNHGSKANIVIGDKSIIQCELLTFTHGGRIEIGSCVSIGEGTRIWSSDKIKIGNRVLISHNVNIHDNISHSLDPVVRHEEFLYIYEHHSPMPNDSLRSGEIIIDDDVWIGFNVTILKGVRIGRRAIIGANTMITKDVPEGAVIIGPYQKILKYV